MQSFVDRERTFGSQPARLGSVLARVDVAKGREQLYVDQLPELLRALAEQTRVASITASSAIEGVIVDDERAEKIAKAPNPPRFRNRNEREFAGYRDAIDVITNAETQERMSTPLIANVHRQLFGHTRARGGYIKRDDNFIVSYESGQRDVLFTPVSHKKVEFFLAELVTRYNEALEAEAAHPVVLVGAFILDFLSIHPFADGNGRVARILTTQTLLERGYRISRYVSVEQKVFDTKNAYYQSLFDSQRGWHEGNHKIWPWVEYLAGVLAESYDQFESRVANARGLERLSKQERVRVYVLEQAPARFRVNDLRRALPGISDPTIRLVLSGLKNEGKLEPDGNTGPHAGWVRLP
jgi:Fic family protein